MKLFLFVYSRQTMSLQRPKKYKDVPSSTTPGFSGNRSNEEISRLTASEPAPAFFPYSHSHASSAAINIPYSGLHSGILASSYQSSTGTYACNLLAVCYD